METISSTKPKARKEHKCNWCGGIIKVGEIYERQFLKYDEVYVWKNHIICSEIANKLLMFENYDEGLDDSDFCEHIKEEFHNIQTTDDYKTPDFLEE